MQSLLCTSGKTRLLALSAATAAALAFSASVLADITQSGEQKNMKLVGHDGLQGRGSYQPNVIQYPDGKTVAFLGLHNGPNLGGGTTCLPNPLNGGKCEDNGTMIVDISDPSHPVEKFHLPVPVTGGQAQMTRMCLGSDLPGGTPGAVYLLRNIQGSSAAGYEIWDVTNPSSPKPVAALRNIRSTHKDWWECSTGIAYMPGSKNTAPLWRESQSMLIYDWSNPPAPGAACTPVYTSGASCPPVYANYPRYIRTYGLPGTQPGATGPVPPALHGPISAHDHPNAAGKLVNGTTADDIIGNRIYLAWGIGSDGIVQILNRKKLLPPAYGGTYMGDPDMPTEADLLSAQVGRLDLSPDQGGHTSMPVFGLAPKSLQESATSPPANAAATPSVRDILMVTSEAGDCTSYHWGFALDISTENSIGERQNPWQGPMVLSTLWVDPASGEKFPRGNYCLRGQRFGTHSTEENFRSPYYGRLTFTAFFNAGVRAWDIRDPQKVVEAGFYVPAAANNTYMTNNVEVDNRGYIIIVDRIGNGMDILKLTGRAREIGLPGSHGDDD